MKFSTLTSNSVRHRFLAITMPLIFLSVMGVFSVIEILAHKRDVARLDQFAEKLLGTQGEALANPMWNLDTAQIKLSLKAIAANREIAIARAFSESGDLIAEDGVVPTSQDDTSTLTTAIFSNSSGGGRKIGELELIVTKEVIWAQTRSRLILAGGIALLAVIMEVGAALFALRQIIGRPLDHLLTAINAEKAGEQRLPVPIQKMDEMGQVITSFNEMLEQQEVYESELAQQARMENELGIGRDLQLAMIPSNFKKLTQDHALTIWGEIEPAREVGGDFYDAFFLDVNTLCVCIGDVADKGVPAALYMAVTKTMIRAFSNSEKTPDKIVEAVNKELSETAQRGMFVTLFVATLDVRTGRLSYTNAGHNTPFVVNANGQMQDLTERHGPVIGASASLNYAASIGILAPGESLFMYTDGVTEAISPSGHFFGDEALKSLVARRASDGTAAMTKAVLKAVKDHEQAGNRSDDVTILAVTFEEQSSIQWHAKVPASLQAVSALGEAMCNALSEQDQSLVARAQLVLDEIGSNVVNHNSDKSSARQDIEVSVSTTDTQISLTISDSGPHFDPASATKPDLTSTLENRPVGGLGLHIVKQISDAFRYVRENDKNVYRVLLSAPQPTTNSMSC